MRLYDRVPLLDTYFENIGEAQTDENGQARVDIDPLFEETVNTSCPYQVFLQPYCGGVFLLQSKKRITSLSKDRKIARLDMRLRHDEETMQSFNSKHRRQHTRC